jgi:hypothetical protein
VRGLAVFLTACKDTVDAGGEQEGSCPCMSASPRPETLRETMLKQTYGSASLRANFKRD